MSKYDEIWDVNWSEIDVVDLMHEAAALIDIAKKIAPEYASAKDDTDRPTRRGGSCTFTDLDEEVEFGDIGITVRQTSNTSCNCHAEYHTYEFFIPQDILVKAAKGEDWKTDVMKATIERKRGEELVRAEQTRKDQERAAEDKRKRDLAEFKRLNALYGPKSTSDD